MARTIGTGVDNFSDIIENNYFYIDKTSFIQEWWGYGDKVTLIARPRRFGKTLMLSMTEAFFSVRYAGKGSLFEGLDIWREEEYQKLQGTYPVIFLSFASVKEKNFEKAYAAIYQLVRREFQRFYFLTESDCLNTYQKDLFRSIAGSENGELSSSINLLSEFLYSYYGKRVILLLDEYDTPMQEAYDNAYWNDLVSFFQSFFNATFKTNPYMERALLMGVTRISRESIFSDLNNLKVITTTSEKYKTAFGFTSEEVSAALEEYGLLDQKAEVKMWYDGFRFGDCDNIYNPWSITQYLDEKRFAPYWMNTSSNRLVNNLLQKGSPAMKIVMEDLLQGGTFHTCIEEQIVFDQLGRNANAVWSLLLAGGYLKTIP